MQTQGKSKEYLDFPSGRVVKEPPTNKRTQVQSLVWEDPTCQGAAEPVHHDYWSPHTD